MKLTIKKIVPLFVAIAMMITILPIGRVQVRAENIFDKAFPISLNDEITFYAGERSSNYYKFTVEEQGICKFDITSNRNELRIFLYDSNGNYITKKYTEKHVTKGHGNDDVYDSWKLEWNTNINQMEGSISFELEPGDYCLQIYSGYSPKGSPETTVSTSFFETDSRNTIKVDDKITCYPTERNSRELNISIKEKGIITFKIDAKQSGVYFYLFDSNGNYITKKYTERNVTKGYGNDNVYDSWKLEWNKNIKQIQGSITYELTPGDYTVRLTGGNDSGSTETTLITTFKSTEPKAASISIDKKTYKLKVGESFTVKLNNVPKGTAVNWYSGKKSVATVDKLTGLVKAKKAGKANIYAKIDGKKYKCKVTVVKSNKSTMTSSEVEKEVSRIRVLYNEFEPKCQNKTYSSHTITGKVIRNDDGKAMTRIVVPKGVGQMNYSRYYYLEDDKLIFAYIEGKDSYRLYFKNERLFRLRYTASVAEKSKAVNHDNEDSAECRSWEKFALDEAYKYLNY